MSGRRMSLIVGTTTYDNSLTPNAFVKLISDECNKLPMLQLSGHGLAMTNRIDAYVALGDGSHLVIEVKSHGSAWLRTLHNYMKYDQNWLPTEADILQVGNSTFKIVQVGDAEPSLVGSDGVARVRGLCHQLLRGSPVDSRPFFFSPTAVERYAQQQVRANPVKPETDSWLPQRDYEDPCVEEGLVARAARLAIRRIHILLTRPMRGFTPQRFRREARRLARVTLRRMLGVQRHHHTEAPEAVKHSHTVDQYLIRGPDHDRKTPTKVIFWELALT